MEFCCVCVYFVLFLFKAESTLFLCKVEHKVEHRFNNSACYLHESRTRQISLCKHFLAHRESALRIHSLQRRLLRIPDSVYRRLSLNHTACVWGISCWTYHEVCATMKTLSCPRRWYGLSIGVIGIFLYSTLPFLRLLFTAIIKSSSSFAV